MFQWLSAVCTSNSFRQLSVFLMLAFCQIPVFAAPAAPDWTVPERITSDDGYAVLEWAAPQGDPVAYYRITEVFNGQDKVHYVESTSLKARRIQPGKYLFKLQSCVKDASGLPDCGASSRRLTLKVSDAVTATLLTEGQFEPVGGEGSPPVDGGPDQLRPGHWYNPAKDGQGWSFYWANRLALKEKDPLFGNSYDLVGTWFTFEAKFYQEEVDCSGCPPIVGAYRPVVLTLKAVLITPGTYGGSLYVSQSDGHDVWVGDAYVIFGANNRSATINWTVDFKKESLADSDPLSSLIGSDPTDYYNISHLSGPWKRSGNNNYFVVSDIGSTAELTDIVFHDDAGDPVWIQAVKAATPVTGSTDLCLAYLRDGYSPASDKPSTWAQDWHMSGCDSSMAASGTNRNGRRYFTASNQQYIWANFTMPGTSFDSGSISIGSSSSPVGLNKIANFHAVNFDISNGTSCQLTNNKPVCNVALTWFTDGNFPAATVFAHNKTNNVYTRVLTSTQPVMRNISFNISAPGVYEFELRMGNGTQTTLLADSRDFTVTENMTNSPPVLAAPQDQVNNEGETVSYSLSATDPDTGDVLTFSATGLPSGLSMHPSGNVSGQISANAGQYMVTATVTDDHGNSDSKSFKWTVTAVAVNNPPTIGSVGVQNVLQNTNVDLVLPVNDIDGDALSCSFGGSSLFDLSVQIDTGNSSCIITGLLQEIVGGYTTNVFVSDNRGGTASTTVVWNILAAGGTPETPPLPVAAPDMTASSSSSRVGTTAGEFRVDESGSATYTIPILTAPASGGLQPQVSLNYSSQAGPGNMGVGWTLSGISTISRCAPTMEQDGISGSKGIGLNSDDRFCLDGQRLILDSTSGAYGADGSVYRTEIDGFSRITSYGSAGNGPAWFKVETKGGAVIEYGRSSDSRIEARGSATPSTVFTWAQNRLEDRFRNYILFTYQETNSGPVAFVLKEINYSGNTRAGTSPSARLTFAYSDRTVNSDLAYSYSAGVKLEQRKLLQSIRSQGRINSGSPLEDLRFYDLSYAEDGTGRKILTSVTECRSSSKATCYPPTSFEWLKSENKIDRTASTLNSLLPKSSLTGLLLADVNGDGRPDLLYSEIKKKQFVLKVKTATSNLTFTEWPTSYALPKTADRLAPQLFAIDVNADGLQDIVYGKYVSVSDDYRWMALISTGSGFKPEAELNPAYRFFLNGGNLESRIQVMDFNGDGLSDILHTRTDALGDAWQLSILLNESSGGISQLADPINLNVDNADLFPFDTPDGWEMSTRPLLLKWGTAHVNEHNTPDARVFDFNGDGAVDLLLKVWRQYQLCVENCTQQAPGKGGKGGGKPNITPDPVFQIEFASFWVLMESSGQNAFNRHSIVARGEDCTVLAICGDPVYDGMPNTDNMWPVDINSDGLADFAWGDPGNNWYFRLNTGNGFEAPQAIGQVPFGVGHLARFEDWNGDSYPDLVYPSGKLSDSATWMVYQNHFGRMFAAVSNTLTSAGNVGGNDATDPVENDGSVFADFDGDGKLDLLLIDHDTSAQIIATRMYEGMNVSGSRATEPSNVITTITNGLGAFNGISYKPLTDPSVYTRMHDGAAASWGNGSAVYDLTLPMYIVSQASISAPVYNSPSATSQVQYHYVGARMQAGGRGFLGFAEVVSYDAQSKIRTNTRYRQDFPFVGMPADIMQATNASNSRFERLSNTSAQTPHVWSSVTASTIAPASPGGTLVSYAINEWSSRSTISGSVFPYIADSLERSYTLSGGFDRKLLTSSSYDTSANLTSSTLRTYATDGTSAFATQSTANVYWSADFTNWRLGRLKTSAVTHSRAGMSSITRKSAFEYDSTTDSLNKETIEPSNSSLEVVTAYGLDSFGNRASSTVTGRNMSSRTDRISYDSLGRLLTETRNALGQVTQRIASWDAFGNPLSVTNIDGVKTTSAADLMGRPFISYTETGVWTKTINQTGAGSYCPVGTAFHTTATGGGAPTQVKCFDKLARENRTAVSSFSGGFIYADQYFDASNRVARISEPYFSGVTRYWNQTAYDDLGRITALLSAGGDDMTQDYDNQAVNSCTSPSAGIVLTTNGLGHQRVEIKNVLDETMAVYDDNCGLINYEYDAVGNLKEITGADGEVVTMTYDLAGRKTSLSDPDKGYWQYAYNALGEMSRQLDSKDQAVDFAYDALGRVEFRRELRNVASLTDSVYTTVNRESTQHLESSSGKSKIVTYRSGEAGVVLHRIVISYDEFGRVDTTSTTINGNSYAEQVTYDQYSRLFQQFDASGDDRGLRYVYSNGYTSQLKEARDGTSGIVYQEIQTTDARGNVTLMQLGNGVSVQASYGQSSGRLQSLSAFDAMGVALQDVDYLFDVLGNLKQRHDQSAGSNLNETFTYDTLSRLKNVGLSVNGAAPVQTLSLNYDNTGNITYKSDVGSYLYNGSHPHAVSSTGTTSYNYDTNGNQTSGDGRNITYTIFDKPDNITKGNALVRFSYGIGNSRYQRKDYEGGTLQKSTLYLGSTERITENGSTFFKRYLAGIAIATYYPLTGIQQLSYLLKDHIGSIHTVLNDSALITATMHFDAFGQRQDANWKTPLTSYLYAPLNDITTRGFTGHEQVDSVGIVHMNGRIYDPKLGRFLQADPVVQSPKNSQSLNRYSYVLNNPLSYTDPSGYFSLKSFFRLAVAAVATYVTYGAASAWAASWLAGNAIAAGAVAGGISGFVGGGIASGTLRGAFFGALTGSALGAIGGSALNGFGKTISGGTAGGVVSELQGGKFTNGFLATSVGLLSGLKFGGVAKFSKFAGAAIVGGTISELTGGSFASGATSAGLAYIAAIGAKVANKPTPQEITYAKLAEGVYDPGFTGAGGFSLVQRFDDNAGLQAALFVNGSDYVLAFAGTSPGSWANWKANLRQAFGFESSQYRNGVNLARITNKNYRNVSFTGHSLGGGIASVAAAVTGGNATVFNAAGVHPNTMTRFNASLSGVSIKSYYSSFDLLRFGNGLTPASVPGQQFPLGAAGWHPMGGVCRAVGCY